MGDDHWIVSTSITDSTHFDSFESAMKVVREKGIEKFEIYRVKPERMYAELNKGATAQ